MTHQEYRQMLIKDIIEWGNGKVDIENLKDLGIRSLEIIHDNI